MPKAPPTKKLYALSLNGREIVSVEMENVDFLPCRPNIKKHWLRGIIETQTKANLSRPRRRNVTPVLHKTVKA